MYYTTVDAKKAQVILSLTKTTEEDEALLNSTPVEMPKSVLGNPYYKKRCKAEVRKHLNNLVRRCIEKQKLAGVEFGDIRLDVTFIETNEMAYADSCRGVISIQTTPTTLQSSFQEGLQIVANDFFIECGSLDKEQIKFIFLNEIDDILNIDHYCKRMYSYDWDFYLIV